MPVRASALLTALLPAFASAFVTISQSLYGADLAAFRALQNGTFTGAATATLGFLWNFPTLTTDTRGLGGGIAWAWDDSLCPAIEPLMKEDLFFWPLVRCKDLKAAMHRAFDSWAANHRFISFVDVSEDCRRLHGSVTSDCELVELWVTSRDPSDPTLFIEAARAWPDAHATEDFQYTNGERPKRWDAELNAFVPRSVIETRGGTISFTGRRDRADDLCWYLDSTFCSTFHNLKTLPGMNPGAVRTYGLALVLFVTGSAGLLTLLQLFCVFRAAASTARKETSPARSSTRGGPPRRAPLTVATFAAVADSLAKWSICCTACRFVLFVTPWLFYDQIFMPCFNCYDFEASAMHEIGHILGLSHPDRASDSMLATCTPSSCGPGSTTNLVRRPLELTNGDAAGAAEVGSGSFASQSCERPFDAVDEVMDVRSSAMISFTQHNPRPCLLTDDLEALHTLYPDCGHGGETVVCFKTQHNIGFVRLGVYFLMPVLVALLAAVCIAFVTQRHQLRRMRSATTLIRQKSIQARTARRSEAVAVDKAMMETRAREELQMQLAVAESSVQDRIDEEVLRTVQACTASAECQMRADGLRDGRGGASSSAAPGASRSAGGGSGLSSQGSWCRRALGLTSSRGSSGRPSMPTLPLHRDRADCSCRSDGSYGSSLAEDSAPAPAGRPSRRPSALAAAISLRRFTATAGRPSTAPSASCLARESGGSYALSISERSSAHSTSPPRVPAVAVPSGASNVRFYPGTASLPSPQSMPQSPPSPTGAPAFDVEVRTLREMGFGEPAARSALLSSGGELERAIEILASDHGGGGASSRAPSMAPSAPASARPSTIRKSSFQSERV